MKKFLTIFEAAKRYRLAASLLHDRCINRQLAHCRVKFPGDRWKIMILIEDLEHVLGRSATTCAVADEGDLKYL